MSESYMMVSTTYICLAAAIFVLGAGYDVSREIKELKLLYGSNVPYRPGNRWPNVDKLPKRQLFGSSTYCHSKLGCFPTDGDFSQRLVNLKPNDREVINTQFSLYTRVGGKNRQILKADDPATIMKSLFSSARPTKFIVHGFLESTQASWFQPMNAELLKNGDYNVINVDWGGLRASKTLYTQATANTRVVAAEIVYLLKTLVSTRKLKLDDVHLIGHSLGAHIAGYVGKNLSAAINRISGLDPAEPYFQGYSTAIRLDPSDAKFVDVIHSDANSLIEAANLKGGFGTSELSGHADFFPNGGDDQPNCHQNGIGKSIKLENDLYEGIKRFFTCDHDRALKYFTESVNDCNFTGIICSTYKNFEAGKCSTDCDSSADHCNSMGFNAHKPSTTGYKRYYLHTTGKDGKFCAAGFQVKVTVGRGSYEFKGSIAITVTGSNRVESRFTVNKDKTTMKPGTTHTYQVGVTTDLKKPVGLEVVWTRDLSWWRVVTKACGYFGWCSSIKIHEIQLTASDGKSYHFCGSGEKFKSKTPKTLFYSRTGCGINKAPSSSILSSIFGK